MTAIKATEFAALMQPLGPFEARPHMAVAVSGGADSMALALLSHAWCRQRGGTVTALTVDHGLRRAARGEARQVHAWLAGHGISHQTLRWRGTKPLSGIQAAARQARYDLLATWCRRRGVLHLLVAHHGDDQAETIFLRLEKGSGPAGLAGMPTARALPGVRLLRPLLARRRTDLTMTLAAKGQPWLEDPSNQEPRFARIRARRRLAGDDGETRRLLAQAQEAGTARSKTRLALAALAARTVKLHPAGFCHFDADYCLHREPDLLKPLLGDILRCIGGGIYRPRRVHMERLCEQIKKSDLGGGRTLAGARLLPKGRNLLICREAGRLPGPGGCENKAAGRWDRFDWTLKFDPKAQEVDRGANLFVAALGPHGWRQVRDRVRDRAQTDLPGAVRVGLPALWQDDQVVATPHLILKPDDDFEDWRQKIRFSAQFNPIMPLQPDGLVLV